MAIAHDVRKRFLSTPPKLSTLTALARLRRSRVVPASTLAILLVSLFPHVARADDSAPAAPPSGLSLQAGQPTAGAAETSAAGVAGLVSASVEPSSGMAHASIPFALPAARGSVQPSLGLTYSSSGGFGVGGRGWSLGLASIERHNISGEPQFQNDRFGSSEEPGLDHFTYGGQRLVEICYIDGGGQCVYTGTNTTRSGQSQLASGELLPSFVLGQVGWHYYRLETDSGSLSRFFWSGDHQRWVVQDKSGEVAEYGSGDAADGSVDRDGSGNPFRWNIAKRYDPQSVSSGVPGNLVEYVWTAMSNGPNGTNGTPLGYLTDIYDTPHAGVASPTTDSFAHHTHLSYIAPSWTPSTTSRVWRAPPVFLLSRVDVASQDYAAAGARQQVRRYYLTYTSLQEETSDGPPSVETVQLEGNCVGAGNPAGAANNFESNGQLPDPSDSIACQKMTPAVFTYSPVSYAEGQEQFFPTSVAMPSITAATSVLGGPAGPFLFDVNDDGLPDLIDPNATPPAAFINSGGLPSTFASQPISLGSGVLDLTTMSQLTPGPSALIGSFQMDGQVDLLWSNFGQWLSQGKSNTPAWPAPLTSCPASAGVQYYCDPTMQYAFLNASSSAGQWSLTPSAGGTFPLGAESPMIANPYSVNALFPFGPEVPFGAVDMDGDGVTDLLTQTMWDNETNRTDPSTGENLPYYGYNNFSIRFSKRSDDGTYWPFYGSSASAATAGVRTDLCMGGLVSTQEDSLLSTFADVDGDGIMDFVRFGTPSGDQSLLCETPAGAVPTYCMSPPTWWRGHGDGNFGICADGTTNCACSAATSEILLPIQLPTTPGSVPPGSIQTPVPVSPPFAMHDVTGDGLADLLVAIAGGFDLYVNQGTSAASFGPAVSIPVQNVPMVGGSTPIGFYFADMNGSGIDDVIVAVNAPNPGGGAATTVNFAYVDLFGGYGNAAGKNAVPLRPGLLTDIDTGRGETMHITYASTTDLAIQAAASGNAWSTLSPQPLRVVTELKTTLATSDIYVTDYTYANPVFDGHDNKFLGFSQVRQAVGGDPANSTNTDTTYFYGACGASEATVCPSGVDYPQESYRGLPTLVEVSTGETSPVYLSSTHHAFASSQLYVGTDDRVVRRLYERQSDTFLYDTSPFTPSGAIEIVPAAVDLPGFLGGGVTLRGLAHHLQKLMSLDAAGNVTSVLDNGDVGDTSGTPPDAPILTSTTWSIPQGTDPVNSWIWRPQSTSAGPGTPDNTTHTTQFAYDAHGNATDVTRALVGTYALWRAAGGAPSPDGASQDGAAHVAHVDYDLATGNIKDVQSYPSSTSGGGAARCTEYTYDPAYAQLRTQESQDVGGCGSGQTLTTQHKYDRVLAVETLSISPRNAQTATTYDWFGRPLSVANPDPQNPGFTMPATTNIAYTDYPNAGYGQLVHITELASSAADPTSSYVERDTYVYKDAMGRTIAVASTADTPNEWVVSDVVVRDTRGNVTVRFVPHFVAGSDGTRLYPYPLPTVPSSGTSYDSFNRLTETQDIDGAVMARIGYHALSAVVQDAEMLASSGPHAGGSVVTTRDGHGRPVKQDHYGNGGVITTQNSYQATGELVRVQRSGTDVNGAVNYSRTMHYDSMGRLVANFEPNTSSDPQMWRYAYDDLGDLVGTSDARGCGKNLFYDGAGRILAEDYSPCAAAPAQVAWTAPTLSTGDGTEAYYVYEGAALQTGAVSDVYDRASHVHVVHDGRGRPMEVDKYVAQPGAAPAALNARYSATEFTTYAGYDERDRLTLQTTGADLPETVSNANLAGEYGPSAVVGSYSPRGILESISSSYGALVTGMVLEADGRPDSITYGDVAQTTATYGYDARARLSEMKVARVASAFPTAQGTYVPPPVDTQQPTQQTVLADDVVPASTGYDKVSNPLEIDDARLLYEWWAGSEPVVARQFTYDDSYRVTSTTRTYGNGLFDFGEANTDTYNPPIASSAYASPVPMATGPAYRVLTQSFTYDGLGNTIATGDDLQAFYDRSLGTITNKPGTNQLVAASLSSSSGLSGSLSATYDAAGNMVQLSVQRAGPCTSPAGACDQLYQYDWDEVGQLARARRFDFVDGASTAPSSFAYPTLPSFAPSADVTYAYDSGGTRVLRSSTDSPQADSAASATLYSVEIFPSLRLNHAQWFEESGTYEETAQTEAVYLTFGGAAYGRVVSDSTLPEIAGPQHVFLEMTDTLSSTAIVIDKDTSELVERTTYLPYGMLDSDYQPDRWNDFREDYKFTGKEEDVEVGLTYFGARYYSAPMGRWASADPLTIHALGADLNPYAYVSGRATTSTDPLGLDPPSDVQDVQVEGSNGYSGYSPSTNQIEFFGGPNDTSSGGGGQVEIDEVHAPSDPSQAMLADDPKDPSSARYNPNGNVGAFGSTYYVDPLQHYFDAHPEARERSLEVIAMVPGIGAVAMAMQATDPSRGGGSRGMAAMGVVLSFGGLGELGEGALGMNTVYRSIAVSEEVQYVGITNNLARRAAQQLAGRGIQIEKVMGGLSRADARSVEQALIEIHGLGKNGGSLLNKINSVAASNPQYAEMLQRGYELLTSIGYQ